MVRIRITVVSGEKTAILAMTVIKDVNLNRSLFINVEVRIRPYVYAAVRKIVDLIHSTTDHRC